MWACRDRCLQNLMQRTFCQTLSKLLEDGYLIRRDDSFEKRKSLQFCLEQHTGELDCREAL